MQIHENVLLLDDEEDIRESIIILNKVKHRRFLQASNPLEAFELLKKHHFDAIVCDVSMPHMSGIEFIQKLRSEGNQIPILFITGQDVDLILTKIEGCTNFIIVEKLEVTKISGKLSDLILSSQPKSA